MKKLLMFSVMSLAVLATSCKKDNDDNGNGEPTPQPQAVTEENIEGTWKLQKMDVETTYELFGTTFEAKASSRNEDANYVFTRNPREVVANGKFDFKTDLYVDGTLAGTQTDEVEYDNETSTWILIENNTKIRMEDPEFGEPVDFLITKFTTKEFFMEGTLEIEDPDLGVDMMVKIKMRLEK